MFVLNYLQTKGFNFIPLPDNSKVPNRGYLGFLKNPDMWITPDETQQYNTYGNIVPEGYVVLDFDLIENFENLVEIGFQSAEGTFAVKTKQGMHLYFKIPVGENKKIKNRKLGFKTDVKCNGKGYVVSPTSYIYDTFYQPGYINNGKFVYLEDNNEKIEIKTLKEQYILEYLRISKMKYHCFIQPGNRNNYLAKELGGYLRNKNLKSEVLENMIKLAALNNCGFDLQENSKEIEKIIKSVKNFDGKKFKEKRKSRNNAVITAVEELNDVLFAEINGEVYRWDDDNLCYIPQAEECYLEKYLSKFAKNNEVSSYNFLYSNVKNIIHHSMARIKNYHTRLVPFQNCYYNFDTQDFNPYDVNVFVNKKFPVHYTYSGEDIIKNNWIYNLFSDWVEDPNTLADLIGICMLGWIPDQKIYFLHGAGRNGKSSFTQIVEAIVGENYVSSVSLDVLGNDRHSATDFVNKRVNLSGDNNSKSIKQTGILKQLSGGDSIRANPKNQNAFNFLNAASLIFSVNSMPKVYDQSFGFRRRMVKINFKKIAKNKIDYNLSKKIKDDQKSLSELASYCLIRIINKHNDGNYDLTGMAEIDQDLDYQMASDNFYFWLDNFVEEVDTRRYKGELSLKTNFWKSFISFSNAVNGRYRLKKRKFYDMLRSENFEVKKNSKNKEYFIGKALRSPQMVDVELLDVERLKRGQSLEQVFPRESGRFDVILNFIEEKLVKIEAPEDFQSLKEVYENFIDYSLERSVNNNISQKKFNKFLREAGFKSKVSTINNKSHKCWANLALKG